MGFQGKENPVYGKGLRLLVNLVLVSQFCVVCLRIHWAQTINTVPLPLHHFITFGSTVVPQGGNEQWLMQTDGVRSTGYQSNEMSMVDPVSFGNEKLLSNA